MQYIQVRLNEINLSYVVSYSASDATGTLSYKVSGAQANTSSCSLAFHDSLSSSSLPGQDTLPAQETDKRLSFRDVKAITVTTKTEQFQDPVNGRTVTELFSPTVYLVRIKMNPGKKAYVHFNDKDLEVDSTSVDFLDEDVANRFAKALNHAAQLCGAVDNDPFK
jgi:hypothetical protein